MKIIDRKYCIFGTGGFGRETLLCLIDQVKRDGGDIADSVVFMIDDEYFGDEELMGVRIIPLSKFEPDLYQVVVAVGDPVKRREVVQRLPESTHFGKIIHPNAVISDWAVLGEGAIITSGVIMTCQITVGNHAHLNLNTTVGHDCLIGDYFTTAPGVNISGNCNFGDDVYLGTASAVREAITITSSVTVGMGGIVVKNIERPGTYVGNPAKLLN